MTAQLTVGAALCAQEDLFPDLPGPEAGAGVVYLMTDGLLLKWGHVTRYKRLRQRKGELRAEIVGWKTGDKDIEAAYLKHVKAWRVPGTEWFRVPHNPDEIYWLWMTAKDLYGWGNRSAPEALAAVIGNNLRQRAA